MEVFVKLDSPVKVFVASVTLDSLEQIAVQYCKRSLSASKQKLFNCASFKMLVLLLNIVLTITILIGQEPPAYFENSRDFVDKHDYSIICYPIICADYTVRSAQCASLAKERES